MPRAPGPLPPWARDVVAALRLLGQHLARLRHQLGRQLARVARRGTKTLALGEEAKAPYVELAQADAKRYKAEAAAYLAKM